MICFCYGTELFLSLFCCTFLSFLLQGAAFLPRFSHLPAISAHFQKFYSTYYLSLSIYLSIYFSLYNSISLLSASLPSFFLPVEFVMPFAVRAVHAMLVPCTCPLYTCRLLRACRWYRA